MLKPGLCAALAFWATASFAESKLLVVSSVLADSSLVAPVIRAYGTNYEAGISGWTIDGEWRRGMLVIAADATPLNAHNSNRIYSGNRRDRGAEYENASYRVRAGLKFKSGLDVRAVVLYESVDGLPPSVADRWSAPYRGIEAGYTYSRIKSREPLIASFDGIETTARAEVFFGKRDWSRLTVTEAWGKTSGRFHLSQSAALLTGSDLDIVNSFVAGGSWDTMRAFAVYGFRYGELRVENAVIANGGIDYRVAGNWRVGVRGSLVAGDGNGSHGLALHASTIWKTIGAGIGVGKPKAVQGGDGAMVFATLIVPLYRK